MRVFFRGRGFDRGGRSGHQRESTEGGSDFPLGCLVGRWTKPEGLPLGWGIGEEEGGEEGRYAVLSSRLDFFLDYPTASFDF